MVSVGTPKICLYLAISEFVVDNKTLTDPNEIANAFNNYFISVGRSLSEQLRPAKHFNEYLQNPTLTLFNFTVVDEKEICNIINNLKPKSSYGHDHVSNVLIKKACDIVMKPLTLIINQTLNTGVFPQELKISRVKPLFKRGDVLDISNYRPISLLSSFSKVFEYVIFHQLFGKFNRKQYTQY